MAARRVGDWEDWGVGKEDTTDANGQVIMHAVVRCLRPGSTSCNVVDILHELQEEGYGLPKGVGWWVGNQGELDTNAIPRSWGLPEWQAFVAHNWPRVSQFEFRVRNRNGRLKPTEPHTLATNRSEVLYILPTAVSEQGMLVIDSAHPDGVFVPVPFGWARRVVITVFTTTCDAVCETFRRTDRVLDLVNFVHSLPGSERRFRMVGPDGREIATRQHQDLPIGVVFSANTDVHVFWGDDRQIAQSEKEQRDNQKRMRRLFCDIQHSLRPNGWHTNHIDVFLADPWGSFLNRDRESFKQSASLVVNLKVRGDDGEVIDVGGYDVGGPSRAFLTRLMGKVGELAVLCGGMDDKLLQMDLQEYHKGTYKEMGMAIALSMGCGGAAPTFMGAEMAQVISSGTSSLLGKLDKDNCLKRGYLSIRDAEKIARIENAENVQYLKAAVESSELFGSWTKDTYEGTPAERQMLKDYALHNAVIGRHFMAYDQLGVGLGRVHLPIARTKYNRDGFEALCKTGRVVTSAEFLDRIEFHGTYHEGGTNEGSSWERARVYTWVKRYIVDLERGQIPGVRVADLHEAMTGQPELVTSSRKEDMVLNIGTQLNNERGGVDVPPLRLTRFMTCGTLMMLQLPCVSYQDLAKRTTMAIQMSSPTMIIDRMDRVFNLRNDASDD